MPQPNNADLAPSEATNELTDSLDTATALGFVRTLRGVDAQLFAGWRAHAGLLDAPCLASAAAAAAAAAELAKLGGERARVVISGCGTSGRVAFLTASRCPPPPPRRGPWF